MGIYIQSILSLKSWRINAGVRYDHNTLYGGTVNPRASAVYYLSEQSTLKFLYGEAFQEPAPVQLWGGWSGRAANSGLKPEQAVNLEIVYLYQQPHWLHDISLFKANYQNVVKEEAENAGERDTVGLEYRGKFQVDNFIADAGDITGNFYYTYTKTTSSVTFDHQLGLWVGNGIENCAQLGREHVLDYNPCADAEADLGDIAPHKINASINIPVGHDWNVNVRTNWVAGKALYLRNPLRAQRRKNDGYLVVDANISYEFSPYLMALKVKNLFDAQYYHSGVEAASSGDDFSHRSLGWTNSLIPQVGRNFMLTLSAEF